MAAGPPDGGGAEVREWIRECKKFGVGFKKKKKTKTLDSLSHKHIYHTTTSHTTGVNGS